jgi:hypothetical protein
MTAGDLHLVVYHLRDLGGFGADVDECDTVARALELAGLDPCVDRPVLTVRARCPVCNSPDPQGMWRSLTVGIYGGIRIICNGGCDDARVHHVLARRLAEVPRRAA